MKDMKHKGEAPHTQKRSLWKRAYRNMKNEKYKVEINM